MNPELPPTAGLPSSPFVLIDTALVEDAAAALSRLEGWLLEGKPAAVAACARACSFGEDDAVAVAAWVGTLAAVLTRRIEEVSSWS